MRTRERRIRRQARERRVVRAEAGREARGCEVLAEVWESQTALARGGEQEGEAAAAGGVENALSRPLQVARRPII